MKIYTRTGDSGTTALVGGSRVSKASYRIEAYGTLDELTATLGYLCSGHFSGMAAHRKELTEIISRVMDCSAIVASQDDMIEKLPKIDSSDIERLEIWCDRLLDGLPEIRHFTLPIGSAEMSYASVCRTVARRAERAMVRADNHQQAINQEAMIYINRLSDYLYALSRRLAFDSGEPEVLWSAKRDK